MYPECLQSHKLWNKTSQSVSFGIPISENMFNKPFAFAFSLEELIRIILIIWVSLLKAWEAGECLKYSWGKCYLMGQWKRGVGNRHSKLPFWTGLFREGEKGVMVLYQSMTDITLRELCHFVEKGDNMSPLNKWGQAHGYNPTMRLTDLLIW